MNKSNTKWKVKSWPAKAQIDQAYITRSIQRYAALESEMGTEIDYQGFVNAGRKKHQL